MAADGMSRAAVIRQRDQRRTGDSSATRRHLSVVRRRLPVVCIYVYTQTTIRKRHQVPPHNARCVYMYMQTTLNSLSRRTLHIHVYENDAEWAAPLSIAYTCICKRRSTARFNACFIYVYMQRAAREEPAESATARGNATGEAAGRSAIGQTTEPAPTTRPRQSRNRHATVTRRG